MKHSAYSIIITLFIATMFSNCSSIVNLQNPFEDQYKFSENVNTLGGVAVVGIATGGDFVSSRSRAIQNAQANWANRINTRLKVHSNSVLEEIGENITINQKDIWSEAIEATSVALVKDFVEHEPTYRKIDDVLNCAVTLYRSPNQIKREIEGKVEKEEELYRRYLSTKAFENLNTKAAEFEEWMKSQDN